MLISFEGGGACWDYDTCSGRAGLLGASNPNGIPTDYITQFKAKYERFYPGITQAPWSWARGLRPSPGWIWACAVASVGLVWVYGTARMRQIDKAVAAAPALRVGIVQGNLGAFEKGRRARLDHRRCLEQTRDLVSAGELDLVVWPETVYTRGLRRPLRCRAGRSERISGCPCCSARLRLTAAREGISSTTRRCSWAPTA